ncbi:hypothetical protein EVAR_79735_1 [Eumeta japonica]|uniref:Uncharacterized protein n=1 Tax=Eumeta variegata TaxID=151549 RepID=A0A4C1T9E5_EUMVA|nr:hypothetical protein EVAR_79735_1 [Eumeta japonica]
MDVTRSVGSSSFSTFNALDILVDVIVCVLTRMFRFEHKELVTGSAFVHSYPPRIRIQCAPPPDPLICTPSINN